ncbi:MAG TPA: winged helix-turn-helix domain-containing protein [Polyangiaceae bacterium]|nr:winged helix-turn-helix domain-containing protein [Polyangiaceae bacterium]
MNSATFQVRPNAEFKQPDQSASASTRLCPAAWILRTVTINEKLRLSHVRAQTREWLVVHAADCPPQTLGAHFPDDPSTRALPIVVFAATSGERDRLLQQLPVDLSAILGGRTAPESFLVEVQELQIDKDAYRVRVDGDEIPLPRLQFKLLVALAERRDRVQSRSVLLRDVWGLRETTPTRTVDTNVKRLRERLRSAGRFIQTFRGVGYRFSEVPRFSDT